MEPKTISGRRRRGTGQTGLKVGRRAIVAMSDAEFATLLLRIRKRSGRGAQAKRVARLAVLLRKSESFAQRPRFVGRGLRRSDVLDSIYPERGRRWTHAWNRTQDLVIDVESFSFVDHPVETMRTLRAIAEAEASARTFVINLQDAHCLDIGPFMVLGMLREKMLPVVRGGRITHRLRQVIEAVDLSTFLRMRFSPQERSKDVYPFPLRQRRRAGSSRSDNFAMYVTSEETVDTRFADTVDGWLRALDPPVSLSRADSAHLMTLIGEILDNAKRHSDPDAEDGTWAIAGFMEARAREDGTKAYVCHLAIISPGATIEDTLRLAPQRVRDGVEGYAKRHRLSDRRTDEAALWTVCGLQDTISRVPVSKRGSAGGFGMMTLVETIAELGRSSRPDEQPAMVSYRGPAAFLVRAPHMKATKIAADTGCSPSTTGTILPVHRTPAMSSTYPIVPPGRSSPSGSTSMPPSCWEAPRTMVNMLDMSEIVGKAGTRVLSGKERGENARSHLKVDGLDASDGAVDVTLPAAVDALTPSFFLGMFGTSVKSCGSVEAFLEKYRFRTHPHVLAQIRRGAEYSLVAGSVFGG